MILQLELKARPHRKARNNTNKLAAMLEAANVHAIFYGITCGKKSRGHQAAMDKTDLFR